MRRICCRDDSAVLFLPFPNALDKLFAPQVVAGQAFFAQFPLDHLLRRDAGMIHSRQPERVETLHALAADNHVLNRVVEHVTDVQANRSHSEAA